jgi:Holliday junction resolvase RusA-like endonuclease
MPKINIKPLSVNQAWQGRRFKTKAYDKYISDVLMLLPKLKVSNEMLELEITFGLSSRAADIDNPLKCFIDCLQKRYGFDDKMIYRLIVNKDITKKGAEYIEFIIRDIK